jgi:hypothetical protein
LVVTDYYRGQVVENDGSAYVCISDHTSGPSSEPGVGGSWTTHWDVIVSGIGNGDKGDITVSGGTWTIDNAAVTYAKIQNVSATDRVLGRSSAGAGDIQEITCTAAGRDLLDDVDAAAQRTTLGLGTLATQSGTFSGTSSGTNTGDQTINADRRRYRQRDGQLCGDDRVERRDVCQDAAHRQPKPDWASCWIDWRTSRSWRWQRH